MNLIVGVCHCLGIIRNKVATRETLATREGTGKDKEEEAEDGEDISTAELTETFLLYPFCVMFFTNMHCVYCINRSFLFIVSMIFCVTVALCLYP